jgi:hypothetical protein
LNLPSDINSAGRGDSKIRNTEVAQMKKLLTALLAVLTLAGALCAITGATPNASRTSVAIVGEGTSPLPVLLSSPSGPVSETTPASHF